VETFHSPSSGNTPDTSFDPARACADPACKALYQLMFRRFTGTHGLANLIRVRVTGEAGDAYVDIIGRDYHYYPRIANHGSRVASFEKVEDLSGGAPSVPRRSDAAIRLASRTEAGIPCPGAAMLF
jgi:hypothetical protein